MTATGPLVLLADEALRPALAATGLDRPWDVVRPRPPGPGTGRGPRAVVDAPPLGRVLVKQYLRGGVLARVNRERYASRARFAYELEVGRHAVRAGIPCGEPLAVVLRPAAPGWRAWGISRWIEDAPDLARWFTDDPGVRPSLWRAALAFAGRLADAGLEHRDLNLGNLLAQRAGDGSWTLHVVDLDRARWHGAPLGSAERTRIERRLVRSYRKILGEPPR